MVQKTILLLSMGDTYESLFESKNEEYLQKSCRNPHEPVVCDFYSRNRLIEREEQIQKIHRVLAALEIKGQVTFKQPKIRYQLIEEHFWYQEHHKT
jgi:hypothetical protein